MTSRTFSPLAVCVGAVIVGMVIGGVSARLAYHEPEAPSEAPEDLREEYDELRKEYGESMTQCGDDILEADRVAREKMGRFYFQRAEDIFACEERLCEQNGWTKPEGFDKARADNLVEMKRPAPLFPGDDE